MRGRIVVATTVLAAMVSAAFAQRVPQPASLSETVSWSSGVAYAYDPSGNIVTVGSDTYGYDGVGRLVRSTVNGTERRYAYDAHGNMISCVQWPDTPSASPCTLADYGVSAATNRLTAAVDTDSDPTNDTYDAAGNVVRLAGHTYTYDALDMQVSDSSALGEREYVYDADGERIAIHLLPPGAPPPGQQKLGEWRWTFRDASGKVLREFRSEDTASGMAGWSWVRDYVWRDGQLLASLQRDASGTLVTYHYHLDHLGTPRRVTDDTDRIVGIHDYHPFGVELSSSQDEPLGGSMRFTGHERDAFESDWTTTLDYMHARFYSSAAARFLSVDPYLDQAKAMYNPQGWNRYSYVRNNPVDMTDPDGRCEAICWGLIILGGVLLSGDVANAPVPGDALYPSPGPAGAISGSAQSVGVAFASGAFGNAQTVTRYMSEGEARTARDTGNIPNVGRDGKRRPTHVTTDKPVSNATRAQNRYEIDKPTHRATVPKDRVPGGIGPAPDGRPTTSGGGSQGATTQPIPVKPREIKPMTDGWWSRLWPF